jgi:hypothetical protein
MATMNEIEQRLSAVEQAVAELQHRTGDRDAADNWLQKVRGSFRGDPIFAKMIEYGREIRNADRPDDDTEES